MCCQSIELPGGLRFSVIKTNQSKARLPAYAYARPPALNIATVVIIEVKALVPRPVLLFILFYAQDIPMARQACLTCYAIRKQLAMFKICACAHVAHVLYVQVGWSNIQVEKKVTVYRWLPLDTEILQT